MHIKCLLGNPTVHFFFFVKKKMFIILSGYYNIVRVDCFIFNKGIHNYIIKKIFIDYRAD